ncbi:MAG: glycosyltransferase [Proteobacteria bacterium]|nr:glycosyltransferase [Sideroxydans sp.]MBU4154378.1 glycosyltransferase [Pseudomonadota bacterium]
MKLVVLQTSVGDYRAEFLSVLLSKFGANFLLLAGERYFDGTTITRVNLGANQKTVKNIFMFGNRFSIQFGCWQDVFGADCVVLEQNPRIISNWIFLVGRRILGRQTAVWGHAWSRRGKGKGGTFLRDLMGRLAGNVIAYTVNEATTFRNRLPRVNVFAAPNSLYTQKKIYNRATEQVDSFIYIGRLVPAKKPELAILAFAKALPSLGEARLLIVGDGPMRNELEALSKDLGISERVAFLGHINNEEVLSGLFGKAVASLSPGYVGLSVVQSFSFGTPVLVANDEPHSPEIDAVIEGENAILFQSDDVDAFSIALIKVWSERQFWIKRRESIALRCRENYSAERMADGFLEFVKL